MSGEMADNSTGRAHVGVWQTTKIHSSPRPASLSNRSPSEHGAHALKAELALAPDDEQACRAYDSGTDKDIDVGQFVEKRIAEQKCPQHGGVVEWRHNRGGRVTIALGQGD